MSHFTPAKPDQQVHLGHGLPSIGGGEDLAGHAADADAIIERVARGPVTMVGLSMGGLIAQSVAADRPVLIRAPVLSNTAAKLGAAESWQTRIDAIKADNPAVPITIAPLPCAV